jgi:hypothetical protein
LFHLTLLLEFGDEEARMNLVLDVGRLRKAHAGKYGTKIKKDRRIIGWTPPLTSIQAQTLLREIPRYISDITYGEGRGCLLGTMAP